MSLNTIPARIVRFLSVQTDNPELLRAQATALSRLIPLLYLMVLANGWILIAIFMGKAPYWLTIISGVLLTLLCAVRLLIWWRMRGETLTAERAVRELRRTNRMTVFNCIVFPVWALALTPYGGDAEQFHVVLFLTLSLIGTMLCMPHLRSAAVLAAALAGPIIIGFLVSTGEPGFISIAVNVFIIITALLVIVLIQHRDFTRMVNARTEACRKDREQTRLLQMLDDMPVAVMTVEPDTLNINYVNETSKNLIRKIEHLLPINADGLLGTSIDVFHRHPQHQRRILADPANLPHNARIKLGSEVLELKVSAVTGSDGSYLGPMLTWALVTKEVEAERHILQLAHYDTLTGLPNRITFHEEMNARLATPGNPVGLLFIDLDGFKLVNDTRGHSVGDTLLRQVANRLRATCNGPATVIGRLGGDEFAVLVPHNDAEEAMALAGRIVDALGIAYDLDYDRSIQIGASVGIALAPGHGETAEVLLGRADMALYSAKAAGRGTARMFSPEMEVKIQERVRLEAKLDAALKDQAGLFVFYQPIVDIETGRTTAREALVRWHHPQRGWISPGEFVPVAEQSGLIDRLGDFVLNRACHDAAGWEAARASPSMSRPASSARVRSRRRSCLPWSVPAWRPIGWKSRSPKPRSSTTRPTRSAICAGCATWACGSPWTISERATPRSPTCAPSPSTRSRSTGRS